MKIRLFENAIDIQVLNLEEEKIEYYSNINSII